MDEDLKIFLNTKLDISKELLQTLSEVANEDGKITEEELSLLSTIEKNVSLLQAEIMQILQHNEITGENLEILHMIEKRIVQDASSEVFNDGVVSSDEKKLIVQLFELVSKMTNLDTLA